MTGTTNNMVSKQYSLRLMYIVVGVLVFIFAVLMLVAAELWARSVEPEIIITAENVPDPQLGWLPKPGNYRHVTPEFDIPISVNSLNMNDREYGPADLVSTNRILVVGDSHTFAIGASPSQTWSKLLEARLFPGRKNGFVANAAVIGYSVGQYLERFRGLKEEFRPSLVLVGFSMATDLYDLMPPDHGQFVYGGNAGRVYFDLEPNGELIEKKYVVSQENANQQSNAPASPSGRNLAVQRLKDFLENFALYRRLKRSQLAMWVAMHWHPRGMSLMGGLDTALKKTLSDGDEYRWHLAEAILRRLTSEARSVGAPVAIVIIPYLAQVYDSVWSSSFGTRPDLYDRWISGKRMMELCKRIEATCIDTTNAFVATSRREHKWLNWPEDGHPTPEGHAVIAEVVTDSLIKSGWLADPGHQ